MTSVSFLFELTDDNKTRQWDGLFSKRFLVVEDKIWQQLEDTCNRVQASIDLETGPLLKVALFQLEDGDRLLIVLHHLVVDGLSWRILFEDIGALYRHYRENPLGQPPPLPPKSDSFKHWTERLREYADSPGFLEEKPYWAQVESLPIKLIKRDYAEETTLVRDLATLSFSLTEAETERLYTQAAPVLGAEVWEILITGLGLAFKNVFGLDRVVVALEGHGREGVLAGVDVSRTVGWFTSIYPVVLDFTLEMDLAARIKDIGQMLRRVPHKGIGYGILKYLTAETYKREIEFRLKPQIGFNYLGQFDTDVERLSLTMAEESSGQAHSLRGTRKYDFTVTAMVADRCLAVSIAYSSKQYKPETTAAVLEHYREMLARL